MQAAKIDTFVVSLFELQVLAFADDRILEALPCQVLLIQLEPFSHTLQLATPLVGVQRQGEQKPLEENRSNCCEPNAPSSSVFFHKIPRLDSEHAENNATISHQRQPIVA